MLAMMELALLAFTRLSWRVAPKQLLHSKQLGCVDLVRHSLLCGCHCGWLTVLHQNRAKEPNITEQKSDPGQAVPVAGFSA